MTKNRSIIIGIIIIIVVIFLTGCGSTIIKSEDFKNHFVALGFTVDNNETPKYETDSYLVAKNDNLPFNIEYYEFASNDESEKAYEKYKKGLNEYISDYEKDEVNKEDNEKLIAYNDTSYVVVSRIKNTLIFINSPKSYSKEVDRYLKDIKY